MSIKQLQKQYEVRAKAERESGGSIEINHNFGYVAVDLCDGQEFFFQGDEALNLLDEVPSWISEEDFILAQACNW